MKKNAVMFFLKSLLKSLVVILSVLGVGVISYKVSYEVLSRRLQEGKLDVKQQELEEILDQAQKDTVSKNLIYVVNEKKNITHMLLEICNTNTNNMDYITIPVRTDYIIPAKMYQKLCEVDEEVPQIVRLAKLRHYFANLEDEKAFGYSELIIERLLGTEISYYTVISDEIYKSHYQSRPMTTTYTKISDAAEETADATASPEAEQGKKKKYSSSVTMKVSVISDTYANQLKAIAGDESKIMDYIKAQYAQEEDIMSNLTVYNKIGYMESYVQMNCDNYHYWGIPGSFNGKLFTVDEISAKAFLSKLENNSEPYTEPQNFGKVSRKKSISSKNKKILILNGSRISGLASSKQQELVNAGLNVPKVGDYTQEVLTQTRIVVKKDGMGQDLMQYFKNPEIVVGDVTKGYDIEIILGTVDAN